MNDILVPIPISDPVSYQIKIGKNLFINPHVWLPLHKIFSKTVIITDDYVSLLYGRKLSEMLPNSFLLTFPMGEQSKSYEVKQQLEKIMIQKHCDRDTLIIALGGGVVGDLAGFIASTYMRGISYLQLPTTLLAMIDSSIGGKTAINIVEGKNLIGAFWHPLSVVIDLNFLDTLSNTHIINGLIEACKIFITHDKSFFYFIKNNLDNILRKDLSILEKMIERAIRIKMDIVQRDEKESKERMILNFGHTIGHAIESESNYTVLHGYAVGLGILVETKIAELLGYFPSNDYLPLKNFFNKLGIQGSQLSKINIHTLIQATKKDKKNQEGKVKYVILKNIGEFFQSNNTFAHAVDDDVVQKALLLVSEE